MRASRDPRYLGQGACPERAGVCGAACAADPQRGVLSDGSGARPAERAGLETGRCRDVRIGCHDSEGIGRDARALRFGRHQQPGEPLGAGVGRGGQAATIVARSGLEGGSLASLWQAISGSCRIVVCVAALQTHHESTKGRNGEINGGIGETRAS
jgi:hypothetical protein